MTGYYVSVIDGSRKGLLLGPYDTHEEALANVDRVHDWVIERDRAAHWYGFGTVKVVAHPAQGLPTGRLNDRLPLRVEAAGV